MTSINILQGPSGTVHVTTDLDEAGDLDQYHPAHKFIPASPYDSAEFSPQFDPHRSELHALFDGRDWWPSERHSMRHRMGRPPAHAAKTHK